MEEFSKGKLNMEIRKLQDLKPAEYNPRKELRPGDPEYENIKRSISTFGYSDPIIVNRDGTIIGGHQRYNVLRDLGYDEVSVVVVDLTKDKEKALNVALNKITGQWDDEKLAQILSDIDLSDIDVESTGFSKDEIDDLNITLDKEISAGDDDFDIDTEYDSIEEPTTKAGDIWILGDHRLICGDATSVSDIGRLMEGQKADLLLTDPPYNIDYTGKTKKKLKIQGDSMDADSFREFLRDAFTAAGTAMKAGAAFYIWHADTESYNFRGACMDVGWQIRQCLIWEKDVFTLGRQDYQWKHEPCLYGWSDGAGHSWYSDRRQTTVLHFDRPKKSEEHPTMKPITLFGYLVQNSSKKGDIVLDSFAGSGTTILACEQLGRAARCVELDPKYCDVIVKRWEQYTGLKAKLEEQDVR